MNALTSTKNFVRRNQTKILVTALVVTTTVAVVLKTGVNAQNQFLKDNGLFEKYYDIEA